MKSGKKKNEKNDKFKKGITASTVNHLRIKFSVPRFLCPQLLKVSGTENCLQKKLWAQKLRHRNLENDFF